MGVPASILLVTFAMSAEPPIAGDDIVVVPADGRAVTVDVMANDEDPNGEALSFRVVQSPAFEDPAAPLENHGDGSFTYTPGSAFTEGAVDRFVYEVDDGRQGRDQATVRILPAAGVSVDSALAFDGDGGGVVVPADPALAPEVLSVEMWVYPWNYNASGTRPTRQVLLARQGEYALFSDDGRPGWWASGQTSRIPGMRLPAHTWSHVAVTVEPGDSGGGITFLVNGFEVARYPEPNARTDADTNDDTVSIGTSGATCPGVSSCSGFRGLIDEVRVWSRAPSPAEIRGGMFAELAGSEEGLAGLWTFDEGSGDSTAGRGAAARDGSLLDGVRWTEARRSFGGRALGMDQQRATRVRVDPAPALALTSTLTLETWIQLNHRQTSGEPGFYSLVRREGEYQLALLRGGRLAWTFATPSLGWSSVDVDYVVPKHVWTHVAVTFDQGTIVTYVNGVAVHSRSGPVESIVDADADDRLWIGGMDLEHTQAEAVLDEVRIWNRSLTSAEIRANFAVGVTHEEPGLVAAWPFDESGGSVVGDRVGGHTGFLEGESGAHPIRILRFDSGRGAYASYSKSPVERSYLQVGPDAELSFDDRFTVELWLLDLGQEQIGTLISKEGEYQLAVRSGTLRYSIANTTPGWTWIDTGIYTAGSSEANWVHLALTYDSGVIRAYRNGTLAHEYQGAGLIGDRHPEWEDFRIGGRQYDDSRSSPCCYFNGLVDEVRVWSVARSGAEIEADLFRNLSGGEPGLVAYWTFDDEVGPVVSDRAGDHGGTLVHEASVTRSPIPTLTPPP